MEAARIPRPGRQASTIGRCARDRVAVRSGAVGAQVDESGVRLRVSDRDLRARSQADLRVLRAAVPAGRSVRGARRPQGRQEGVDADRARGVCRGRSRSGRGRLRAGRRASLAGDLAVPALVRGWIEGQPREAAEARAGDFALIPHYVRTIVHAATPMSRAPVTRVLRAPTGASFSKATNAVSAAITVRSMTPPANSSSISAPCSLAN